MFSDYFYIEESDRSGGIRVELVGHGLQTGDVVDVSGTMATNADHERYIDAAGASDVGDDSVSPLGMSNRSLGGADFVCDPGPPISG